MSTAQSSKADAEKKVRNGHNASAGGGGHGVVPLLKKRESFSRRRQESVKNSFEGSFFMDFYFSQGDYKVRVLK